MKKLLIGIVAVIVVAGVGQGLLKLHAVQDVVLERGTAAIAQQASSHLWPAGKYQ